MAKKKLTYLDNAATSFPKPDAVLKAVSKTLKNAGGNPGRSGHSLSMSADRLIYSAREEVSRLLGISDSSRLIFTSGATESLNTAIKGILSPGDHVVTSSMEHNAVARPLYGMAKKGVEITKIAGDKNGIISPDGLIASLRKNTRLIVINHASNVNGAIQPIEELGRIARQRGITFLVDGCQTAGHTPLDLKNLPVDLFAASGHKGLLGPQGTGILFIREGLDIETLMEGGTGSGSENLEQPGSLPDRFESGTPNTPGIAGLGAAARYIYEETVEKIRDKELTLLRQLRDGLKKIRGIKIYGQDLGNRASLLSFNIEGTDPAIVSYLLGENFGISSRSGLHCAPEAHRTIDTYPGGTVRLSPGFFNSQDDIERTIKAISEIASQKQ